MKKLLSLLSVLTISGTAVPTTIAASPYQKIEKLNNDISYSQTNNLENLNRVKRWNNNIFGILKVVGETHGEILHPGIIKNNKVYYVSTDGKVYEYDPNTQEQKSFIAKNNEEFISSNTFLNNKLYFELNNGLHEYDPVTKKITFFIPNENVTSVSLGGILNNKIYTASKNGKIYEYEPLKFIKSNIFDLKEQLKRGLYFYFIKERPGFEIKSIIFNSNNLKYSDIELIKEEELPIQKTTEDICVGETEFENSLSTEQKFKAQSCKYTKQKINSIQIIKGINKRIDNTLESGESSIDTTSTINTNNKTTSVNAGAEVSAGWGPFSASISTSVGSEESNTSQIENSESKTKNISKIISNSSSFDLSNLKEEQEIITNELEYPSQEITVGGNQSIKVIFNLNKIIKKYKVTFKQNISGKVKVQYINLNNQKIESEILIKDIMLSLKENNILPKEIIINNNSVSFVGELIVSKNSSKLKVKTEEIDII